MEDGITSCYGSFLGENSLESFLSAFVHTSFFKCMCDLLDIVDMVFLARKLPSSIIAVNHISYLVKPVSSANIVINYLASIQQCTDLVLYSPLF